MNMKAFILAPLLVLAACETIDTTYDERGYLGLNAGYEFAAEMLAGAGLTGEAAAKANAKRAEVFKALCKARLAYNRANAGLNRQSTPRCVAALGPNPQVTGYDAEILAAAGALAELRTLLNQKGN